MAMDAFLEILENDLRLLTNESKKSDSLTSHLTGWLSHNDLPQIKEATERALLKLRSLAKENLGLNAVRGSKELLRPFLLVCEARNGKLVTLALASLQKMVAHDAVNAEGRRLIMAALLQVEKSNEDGVRLKMLQTALTLMQNPAYADDEELVCQMLGLCFRLYCAHRNAATVANTAAATIRQAVAIVFDHAVLPRLGPAGSASRENSAYKLLADICAMCDGSAPSSLRCPIPPRTFLLELLEFVLNFRPRPFQQLQPFRALLQAKVCSMLEALLRQGLQPGADSSDLAEVKLVMKAVVALVRRHAQLVQKGAAALLQLLLQGCSRARSAWQRICCLQAVRSLVADHLLVYQLFDMFDMDILQPDAVQDMTQTLADAAKSFVATAVEVRDESALPDLNTAFVSRQAGKDPVPDLEQLGPVIPHSEVLVAYLSLDSLLVLVLGVESLTDLVVETDPDKQQPQQGGRHDDVRREVAVRRDVCLNLVDALWRPMLGCLSALLSVARQEALVLALLKGYQCYTYSAGALGASAARDGFLASLCEYTLMSEPAAVQQAEAAASASSTSLPVARGTAPAFINTAAVEARDTWELSQKNVQALRTLFNIAHRLGDCLGQGWVYVMDVLNALDRMLVNPNTTTQEAETQHVVSTDLSILATAANQLFQSTCHMSAEAVVHVTSALVEVSRRALPAFQANPAAPRPAALGRLVETMLVNLPRIVVLWGIFLGHITELMCSSAGPVRSAAIDALEKVVTGALGPARRQPSPAAVHSSRVQAAAAGVAAEPAAGGSVGASREADDAVENMVLVALESFYRENGPEDQCMQVRLGVLRIIQQALQHHGEQLSRGWLVILRLLASVARSEEPRTISSAFACVELVCSDLLSALPKDYIPRCLELIELYGSQKAVMNKSLTAINLLWNATDFVARSTAGKEGAGLQRQASVVAPAGEGERAGSSGGAAEHSIATARGDLSDRECVDLMMQVLKMFRVLAMDKRPEVRNSSVRTMFLAMSTHARRALAAALKDCFDEMMVSLIKYLHFMCSTTSQEQEAAVELGRENGVAVMMLQHHTRNTEQKQWDETLTIALNGMNKVLRQHLPSIVVLEDFDKRWEELMSVCGSCMASGRKNVAMASTNLVTNSLQAHVASGAVQQWMWKRALQALQQGVTAIACPTSPAPIQARLEIINGSAALYKAQREAFDAVDFRQLLGWLERFARCPYGTDDTAPVPGLMPPIQKQVLAVLPQLWERPPATEESWRDVLELLNGMLCPEEAVAEQQQEAAADAWGRPGLGLASSTDLCLLTEKLSSLAAGAAASSPEQLSCKHLTTQWMARVAELLVELYRSCLPWQVKAASFAATVRRLAGCMMMRFSEPADELWRVAAQALTAVVHAGLPSVNLAYASHYDVPEDTWPALADAFEGFLLRQPPAAEQVSRESSSSIVGSSSSQQQQDMEAVATVLDTLTDTVLVECGNAPAATVARLVGIVHRGAQRPEGEAPAGAARQLQAICIRKLAVLCSRATAAATSSCLLDVARTALPLLLERARSILQQFAQDCDVPSSTAVSRANSSSAGNLGLDSTPSAQHHQSPLAQAQRQQQQQHRLDEARTVLQALSTLELHPHVVDTIAVRNGYFKQWVDWVRAILGVRHDRERSFLLLLYPLLVPCITSSDSQVRWLARDLLAAVGQQLALDNMARLQEAAGQGQGHAAALEPS